MSGRPHGCTHPPLSADPRPLAWAFALTAGFMVVEAVAGLLSGSLALLSDAGHMLTDAGALAVSLFALWLARRPPDDLRTYGYHRMEILAALINVLVLWVLVFFILREAYQRLRAPEPAAVEAGWMLAVGVVGLGVNILNLSLLHRQQKENLNVRAAFLHILGDALGSVGVLAAAVVVLATGWTGADAAAAALIALLILYSSWGLLRESLHILLEGVPPHLDTNEVREGMRSVAGVAAVHDLHLWTAGGNLVLLTAHVVAEEGAGGDQLRGRVEGMLGERFGITHTTLQVERTPCSRNH